MNSANQFEAIVRQHYESLYRFAMSLAHTEADARDLTQQAFYIWATKGHQLRDASKVKTWLFTTLHRTFLQARRHQTRFPHDELETVSDQLPPVLPALVNQLDSVLVQSALKQVDEIYQAAVALFYLEDCAYKDIATILEVPIGTVKSRIARGVVQLREILREYSPNPGVKRLNVLPIKTTGHAGADKVFVSAPSRRMAPCEC